MKNITDRETLKSYFRRGSIPTEEQFATLIDSVPNIAEEGQVVRTADGWSFYPEAGRPLQIRLHDAEYAPAVWTLCLTPERGLAVRNARGETVLELGQESSASGTAPEPTPEPGEDDYTTVAADKRWHDLVIITGRGFRMYDVSLFLHDPGTGAGRDTRATALCLNYVEYRIKSPRKHWWGWSGGVELRWHTQEGRLCLQVRSKRRRASGTIFCKIR